MKENEKNSKQVFGNKCNINWRKILSELEIWRICKRRVRNISIIFEWYLKWRIFKTNINEKKLCGIREINKTKNTWKKNGSKMEKGLKKFKKIKGKSEANLRKVCEK